MGRFITELDVRVLGNRSFELLEPLSYLDNEGNIYTIPKGTRTDFASIWRLPIVSTLLSGKCNKESALHDYFYKTGYTSRKQADLIFRESIISNEEHWTIRKRKLVAFIMYYGVRLFGRNSYQGKTEWRD